MAVIEGVNYCNNCIYYCYSHFIDDEMQIDDESKFLKVTQPVSDGARI